MEKTLPDEGVAEQTAVATEQAEPGKGPSQDEIDAARGETIFENNVAGANATPEPATAGAGGAGGAATVTMSSGISRVRGHRLVALLELLAIIGPGAKKLLELIAGFDPSHLQHLLVRLTQYGEIKTPATEPAGREERVLLAAQVFEAWSRMTPGTRDDDFGNWLNRILHDTALRDEFVAIVGPDNGHTAEKIAAAVKDAGIDMLDVLHFSRTIRGVIEALK